MSVHQLTIPETDSFPYIQARFHYLLQIVFGETVAIDYCKTIAEFSPNAETKEFLLKQQKEEDRHLEMLTDYLSMHPRPHAEISSHLKKLDGVMREAIERRDYVESIFIQNFIVEGLNVSLLRELEHHTDGELSEICKDILQDEIGHMDFGVSELERILKESNYDKALINKLIKLQRRTLFPATLLALDIGRESKYLGIPISEFARKTVGEHFERIERAGFPLPLIDKIFFNGAIVFLRVFA